MRIDIKIKEGVISDVRFWTDGCGASIACGSMLTKMTKGKTLEEVNKITSVELLRALDGLPSEHQHCTKLAVDTLQNCLSNYKN